MPVGEGGTSLVGLVDVGQYFDAQHTVTRLQIVEFLPRERFELCCRGSVPDCVTLQGDWTSDWQSSML